MRSLLNRTAGFFILLISTFCISQNSHGQCNANQISTFPYTEDFELTNGSWMPGGSGSDWAWGSPSKPVITGAASGINCWITGGLTGSTYNSGEASWLVSPCFDFSSLQYPYISFNVFWETERRFDGANFQYSTDLGVTWINVGTASAPVNCFNENWFNFSPITYLSPLVSVRDGWSGNIQSTTGSCQGGGGSGRWVFAKQAMPGLAGLPFVIFRFTFGAGTVCNNYDGFAIDNITIQEAPPNNASFTYSCVNNTTVDFINTSALCPNVSWNFGDPASGIINDNSTLQNPTHTFSGPGIYTITLNATGPANAPSTTTGTINILGLTTSVISNNNCFGDNNGAASVNVIPVSAGPFNYAWNTSPPQNTQTATGLNGGNYTVTVNAFNSCSATATAIITEPAALSHTINILHPGCGLASGQATITETGGTGPYTYSWSPYGGTGPTATALVSGDYIVTVTDSKGCFENILVSVRDAFPTLSITPKKDASCFGLSDGTATAFVSGGRPPYMYSWNTVPAQNTATATNLAAGIYTVTIIDNNTCIVSSSVQILEPAAGSCGEVYFPNAFTPNGDGTNDDFGPLGNIAAISNYKLNIFNRYGELIFSSKDPYEKWNGFYKAKIISPGSFTWHVAYTYKGQYSRSEQGSVMIIK